MRCVRWGAPGDHWSNFDLVAVVEHFVFGHEIVAFDDQMRFDLHGWIISRRYMMEQGALVRISHEGS